MIRAVTYGRYSTDKQDKVTLDAQRSQCNEYAAGKDMEIVERFEDEATSGTDFRTRPGMMGLIDRIRRGDIETILCTSPDRLSRDPEHSERMLKIFRFENVVVHYTQHNGPMKDMEVRMRAMFSAEQIADIQVKTREGQREHFKQGKAVAGIPYGYRMMVKHDAKGDRITGLREIHPDEAPIVVRIFNEYVNDRSPIQIADGLNADGVPGPSGRRWIDTTIRGHPKRGTGILNNELYIGRRVWNRQRYQKNPDTEKRNARLNDPSKYETGDAPELRIIDQELWERARRKQAQLSHRLKPSAKNLLTGSQRQRYQFSGLIECGVCGGPFRIIGKDRYGCGHHAKHLGCDNTRTISRLDLETRINGAIPDVVLALRSLEDLQEHADSRRKARKREASKSKTAAAAELNALDAQIANFVAAIGKGLLSDAIEQGLKAAEARKSELTTQLAKPEKDEADFAPMLSMAIVRTTAEAIAAALPDMSNSNAVVLEYRRFVGQLIEKVVAHPEGKRETALEVHGRLASLLATIKAWEDEEKRLRSIWLQKFQADRKAGALASTEEKLQFLEVMNREIEKRKRTFEHFLYQPSVVAGARNNRTPTFSIAA